MTFQLSSHYCQQMSHRGHDLIIALKLNTDTNTVADNVMNTWSWLSMGVGMGRK